MPNIELHSFTVGGPQSLTEAQKTTKRIVSSSPFVDDTVITVCSDDCQDVFGKRQPFIRINDTDRERANTLAEDLRLVADVEVVILEKFLEKI